MAIKISGTTVIDDSQGLRITGISTFTNGPVLVGSATSTGTASQRLQVTGGGYFSGSVGIGSTNPSSTLSVGGTITELYNGTYWNLVSQADIGIGASQVPLNQYLGQLAFLDVYSPSGLRRDGGGADDVVVSAGGSVGIGTTNPVTTLQVQGNSTALDTRFQSIGEKTILVNGNTASLVYNTGSGNIAICTNASGNVTLSVTGIPTDSTFDNNALTFSVAIIQAGTARSCTAVTLNGVSASIKWFGGSLANAISGVTTTTGTDVYTFTGINTVGSASTTTNYLLLGNVNGSYR